jgi:hypothetical protein
MSEKKKPESVCVSPVDRWGRRLVYAAKVGTMSGTLVLIKRARRFYEGQFIYYVETKELEGMSTGCTPRWHYGTIWKIEGGRIFINR